MIFHNFPVQNTVCAVLKSVNQILYTINAECYQTVNRIHFSSCSFVRDFIFLLFALLLDFSPLPDNIFLFPELPPVTPFLSRVISLRIVGFEGVSQSEFFKKRKCAFLANQKCVFMVFPFLDLLCNNYYLRLFHSHFH